MAESEDWFALERVAAPPIIRLLKTEVRAVTLGLSSALDTGQTVTNLPVTVDLISWRTKLPMDPAALVGQPGYDATTKVASQKIDASKLPYGEHIEMRVTFDVNFGTGVETRSVYAVLLVPA